MKHLLTAFCVLILSQTIKAQAYRTNRTLENKKVRAAKQKFGKNIISFMPAQILMTNADQINPDVAVGLSYERIFNNEMMSFKLPVSFSIKDNYIYVMPTLKLYPTKQGAVRYAVGPQLLFGTGNVKYSEYTYNQTTGTYSYQNYSLMRKQFGFLINNSINFTMSKSLYVGIDASLGIIYYDNLPKNSNYYTGVYSYSNNNSNINPAFQLNFNMGYRF